MMDWQPSDDADALSLDTSDVEAAHYDDPSGGYIPWSQVQAVYSSPSESSWCASPVSGCQLPSPLPSPLPAPLPAQLPWIPQARGVDDHLPCARRLRAKREALLAEMSAIVKVLSKEVDAEERSALFWHDKYVATNRELNALKDHMKQAERATSQAIAHLRAEVDMYRLLLDPQ